MTTKQEFEEYLKTEIDYFFNVERDKGFIKNAVYVNLSGFGRTHYDYELSDLLEYGAIVLPLENSVHQNEDKLKEFMGKIASAYKRT